MRVILNSDVIISNHTMNEGLSASFTRLCTACVDHGHVVAIPRTALLEFQRKNRELVDGRRRQLANSYRNLDQYGIEHDSIDPAIVIPDIDLESVLSSFGVQFEIVDASYEQFVDAHRRACLRETPHSGGDGSDEMRDLLIWCTSIDIARADGGAILVSRDKIHAGTAGRHEAEQVGLIRVTDFEAALERLQVDSPAFSLARRLLTPLWPAIHHSGIPVGDEPVLERVFDASFVRDDRGISRARLSARVVGYDGSVIEANVSIEHQDGPGVTVDLDDVMIDGQAYPPQRLVVASGAVPFDIIEDARSERSEDSPDEPRSVLGVDNGG
jgi:hypothetical protein